MRGEYGAWLKAAGYDSGTITAQLHRCGRVEQYMGDLDRHHQADRCRGILEALRYSTEDERRGRPNPTRIPINGVLRTNLASYRNAIQLYARFLDSPVDRPAVRSSVPPSAPSANGARAPQRQLPPAEHARTLSDFGFDGQASLEALISTSRYGTIAQAVASLSVFSHPATVAQTEGRALFPTIRGMPGEYIERDGRSLMLDDNKSPTDAFLWANALGRRGRDTQFNHIYAASGDVEAYTALANICMTPAFLAKLTDTHPEVRALLAYRSFDLYGWKPRSSAVPEKPEGYAALEWAPPLPAVDNVRALLEATMARRLKDRTVLAARRLGWLFGGPVATL